MIGYVLIEGVFSVISLMFFVLYADTDKSLSPWLSRELNSECFADDFYSSHDMWHLMASFSLVIMILVNVQISKPCRDCYLSYLTADEKETVRRMTVRWKNGERPKNIGETLQRMVKGKNSNKTESTINDTSNSNSNQRASKDNFQPNQSEALWTKQLIWIQVFIDSLSTLQTEKLYDNIFLRISVQRESWFVNRVMKYYWYIDVDAKWILPVLSLDWSPGDKLHSPMIWLSYQIESCFQN